jgi:hypothetical protein
MTDEATTTTDAPATDAEEAPETAGKTPNFTGDFDPEKAARALENARNGEKTEKQKRQAAETAVKEMQAKLAELLGLEKDEKPDVEAVARELSVAKEEKKRYMIELAAYKASAKAGVNADALLDSRSFLSKVADLDPASETFETDIAKAVSAAVEANPLLKGSPVTPAVSGGDFSSGTKTSRPEPTNPHDRLTRAFS